MKKRVLIIGSSGMLGVDLSKELRKRYDVYGADVVVSPQTSVVRFYHCDITKRASVAGVIRKARPDAVILTAAWTDVDGCERDPKRAYRVNAEGPKNVALACEARGVPLVYISTDFVFNGMKRSAYTESDTAAPLSVYGRSKLMGEVAVRKTLATHYIVRTSWLYGAQGKNFVDTIIAKGRAQPVLRVVDDQVGSPTFTKDLARALSVLFGKVFADECGAKRSLLGGEGQLKPDYGTYHVSNAGAVSWYEYAKTIVRLTGARVRVLPMSSKELDRPAKRPRMSILDCRKFARQTGMRMRPWRDALRDYLKK